MVVASRTPAFRFTKYWSRLSPLNRIGPNPRLFAGQRVAGAVQDFVLLVVLLAEGAEILLAGPAVDGEVGTGNVSVTQQLGAKIARRSAKELSPGAIRAVSGLKTRDFILCNLELPNHDKHPQPQFCLYPSAG